MGSPVPTITLPDVNVTPDAPQFGLGKAPEGPSDIQAATHLATGGAIDMAAQASQAAPLDQLSAARIAGHAGLQLSPDLAPAEKPPEIKPLDGVPPDLRYQYSRALLDGEIDGPQDFSERVAGIAAGLAPSSASSADGGDHAQLANAAQSLAGALPSHEDLIDNSIAISHQVFNTATPETVGLIKQNLMGAWVATGTGPSELAAVSDPDLAAKLAMPQPAPYQQSPHFPTLAELSVPGRDAIQDPLGTMTPNFEKGGGLLEPIIPPVARNLMGPGIMTEQAEYDKKDQELAAQGVPAADRLAQLGIAPVAGALGVGGTLAPEAALRGGLGDFFPTVKSENSELMRATIRRNTGQSRNIKDTASDILEEHRPAINNLLPEHRQFQADMQAYAQARTAAK
jgi:hypothetical protein